MVKKDSEKKFEFSNSFAQQQNNNLCWTLDNPESTMSFGTTITKIFPDLRILLLNGSLGAGKTTLVKGIAKSLGITEPITSPTFALSQHYPSGSPPLIHIDLYRLEDTETANEFFLQEEEQSKMMEAIMVIEWPERLSLTLADAWRGKIEYLPDNKGRFLQMFPPSYDDINLYTS